MTVEPSNDDRMAVMHQLLGPTWAERQARSELYGSHLRSGDVTSLGPDHPPTVKSDASAVLSSRGV